MTRDKNNVACESCPAAMAGRRKFLRDVGLAVAGALALSAGRSFAAFAESVGEVRPSGSRGTERTYAMPGTDGVFVDADNDLALARWQNRIYAFSLRCPHRGTKLEWRPNESRLFCPKHKAKFTPNGAHDSGRQSRDLDRYDIVRQGSSLVVDLGALRRADQDLDAWQRAMIAVQ